MNEAVLCRLDWRCDVACSYDEIQGQGEESRRENHLTWSHVDVFGCEKSTAIGMAMENDHSSETCWDGGCL
jgi:hypothetical protein